MSETHPIFGKCRRLSRLPHLCSICDRVVDEDACPLMLFGKGEQAWLFCEEHEGPIMAMAARQLTPASTRRERVG